MFPTPEYTEFARIIVIIAAIAILYAITTTVLLIQAWWFIHTHSEPKKRTNKKSHIENK